MATYDAVDNPLTYFGKNLTWTGRQLDSLSGDGLDVSYKYDSDGMRIGKTVNGVNSKYYYVGDKLYYEKRGSKELYYNYGSDGNLGRIRMVENGSESYYYAVCNSRGDVVGLYTGSGALRAEYKYDAWGKVISVTNGSGNEITDQNNIALINPIRYRGYYYDSETGYYYLQSRYYNPCTGRFISVDGYAMTGMSAYDGNMFAYCCNNPILYYDFSGTICRLHESGLQGPECPFINGKCMLHGTSECCVYSNSKVASNDSVAMRSRGRGSDKGKGSRKDKRKGSEKRQPTGSRERNVAHPNGEEHSRVAKGNGIRRAVAVGVIAVSVVALVVIAADDITGIGAADDVAIPVLTAVIWDSALVFA